MKQKRSLQPDTTRPTFFGKISIQTEHMCPNQIITFKQSVRTPVNKIRLVPQHGEKEIQTKHLVNFDSINK